MKRVKSIYFVAFFPFLPDKACIERWVIHPPMIRICNFGAFWQDHMKSGGEDLVLRKLCVLSSIYAECLLAHNLEETTCF